MEDKKDQVSPATKGAGGDVLPPVVESEAPVGTIDEIVARGVEAWTAAYIRNSPMSRNTEAYNHLMTVLPQLPSFIGKELSK